METIKRSSNTSLQIIKRSGEDGIEKTYFTGKAISFSDEYTPLIKGKLYERVQRNFIEEGYTDLTDWKVNFDHKNGLMLLGRSSSGTAKMRIETDGVWFEVEKPNTSAGNDLEVLIERGDISGCSFHATCDVKSGDYTVLKRDGVLYADAKRAKKLHDLSIVVDPAYPDTELATIRRDIEGVIVVDTPTGGNNFKNKLGILKLK